MEEEKERELANACYYGDHKKVTTMITEDPLLLCTAKDMHGDTPVCWAVCNGSVKMLQRMLDAILLFSLRQKQQLSQQSMLRDAFERRCNGGYTPAHAAAAWSYENCLVFLVENAPSGVAILKMKNNNGKIPAHRAAHYGHLEALKFALRNTPSGAGVFEMKTSNEETALDWTYPHMQQVLDYIDKIKNNVLPALSKSGNNQQCIYL